jgi:multimeric flavodoxin WrbA
VKVLGISGSPRLGGNTDIAVKRVLTRLAESGVEAEFVSLAEYPVKPCIACYACAKERRCVVPDPNFEVLFPKFAQADAIILGSPVWFGSATPQLMALLDRVGSVARRGENVLRRKIGASIAVARRAGQNFTFAQINMFFLASQMIVPGSSYWNVLAAKDKGDVCSDEEGLRTLDTLAENIGWLLKKLRPSPHP